MAINSKDILENFYQLLEESTRTDRGKLVKQENLTYVDSGTSYLPANYIYNIKTVDGWEEDLESAISYYRSEDKNITILTTHENEDQLDGFLLRNDIKAKKPAKLCVLKITDLPADLFEFKKEIQIKEVKNKKDLALFDSLNSQGFEFYGEGSFEFFENLYDNPDKKIKLYIAYYNDKPSGAGFVFLNSGKIAGNYWGSVIPEMRNKGIATALTLHRVKIAKELGYKYTLVLNFPSSFNLYQRLGFKQYKGILNVCY